ncbi:MAG: hypothetical protein ABI346_05120 [Candidatus Baltobacteraceae bacterium]
MDPHGLDIAANGLGVIVVGSFLAVRWPRLAPQRRLVSGALLAIFIANVLILSSRSWGHAWPVALVLAAATIAAAAFALFRSVARTQGVAHTARLFGLTLAGVALVSVVGYFTCAAVVCGRACL